MDITHIQAEIDALRERLEKETSLYKQAIRDEKSFEEVKGLFSTVKKTLNEIFNAVERCGMAIREVAPECQST